MVITSIVPEIMNSKKIEFFDVNNVPFSICKKSEFIFNFNSFKRPFILIDSFEKDKYKDIEIKRISLEELEKLGYRIASIKTTNRTRNRSGQIRSYLLEFIDKPIPNATILAAMPKEHFLEYDMINKRVRIKGSNVWPYRRQENATPWINTEGLE